MSGHSKWAQIKRQKGVADARRGQLFTRVGREIELAARQGADPQANFRLRLAIQKAKDSRMPQENIERAIKRGAGGGEATKLTSITFEGYGPQGVAIMVETLTDNRNRTVQEVRTTFARHGGSLGESGCVSWIFESRGVITLDVPQDEGETIALKAIDAGAEDVKVDGRFVEVFTQPRDLEKVRKSLEDDHHHVSAGDVSMVPKTVISLSGDTAQSTLKLLDHMEELADVQRIYSNADFSDEALERYQRSLS